MKNLLCAVAAMLLLVACNTEPKSVTTTDADGETMTNYGEEVVSTDAMSVEQLVKYMDGKQDEKVTLSGEILDTCPKKGCWMDIANSDGPAMKVRFKDYGFFVPTDGAEGKTAIMEGRAFRDTMSVDMLRHYAEDAGKSEEEIAKITEPEEVIAFEATGVIIKS